MGSFFSFVLQAIPGQSEHQIVISGSLGIEAMHAPGRGLVSGAILGWYIKLEFSEHCCEASSLDM